LPLITAPPTPHSEPDVTLNPSENEGTLNDKHQYNAEPVNQLRRSSRTKTATNFDDYVTYLTKAEMDVGRYTNPTSYNEAITSDQSSEWNNAMLDELDSMKKKQCLGSSRITRRSKTRRI